MDQIALAKELTSLAAMLFRIKRSVSQCRDSDEPRSISGIQLQAMVMLKNSEALNMTELADRMLMTRQQLTKVIDALVEKGFVVRGADPNNRKHVMIRASSSGEKFIEEMILSRHNMISRLITTLNDKDAVKFYDAIIVIREILEKIDFEQLK